MKILSPQIMTLSRQVKGMRKRARYALDSLISACMAPFTVSPQRQPSKSGDMRAIDEWTPTMRASHEGNLLILQDQISKGVSLEEVDSHGRTALMLTAVSGRAKAAAILIAAGAQVDKLDASGLSPCMRAAIQGHADLLALLIGSGADYQATDKHGRTALMCCCSQGRIDCVSILIEAGANIVRTDRNGADALSMAKRGNHIDVIYYLEGAILARTERDAFQSLFNSPRPSIKKRGL
jgi:ankyrin repeat protein